MNDSDRADFARALSLLAVAFRTESDDALARAYWLALKDIDLHRIKAACSRAMMTCEFMPPPSKLRRLAGEPTVEERAMLAWDAVLRGISKVGAWSAVHFEDPVAGATVRRLGGWQALCDTDSEHLHVWTYKRFVESYKATADSEQYDVGVLPGLNGDGKVHTIEAPYLPPGQRAAAIEAGGDSEFGRILDEVEGHMKP